jgi:hypothetical protein
MQALRVVAGSTKGAQMLFLFMNIKVSNDVDLPGSIWIIIIFAHRRLALIPLLITFIGSGFSEEGSTNLIQSIIFYSHKIPAHLLS